MIDRSVIQPAHEMKIGGRRGTVKRLKCGRRPESYQTPNHEPLSLPTSRGFQCNDCPPYRHGCALTAVTERGWGAAFCIAAAAKCIAWAAGLRDLEL